MRVQQAQFESAYAVVGTITQIILPFHSVGDIVFRPSDFTQNPGALHNLPAWQYRVLAFENITFYDATIAYYQGAVANVAATCSGAPYAPASAQLSDPTTPFFYILQRVIDNKIYRDIHETDVYTPKLIDGYITDNLLTWWDL